MIDCEDKILIYSNLIDSRLEILTISSMDVSCIYRNKNFMFHRLVTLVFTSIKSFRNSISKIMKNIFFQEAIKINDEFAILFFPLMQCP